MFCFLNLTTTGNKVQYKFILQTKLVSSCSTKPEHGLLENNNGTKQSAVGPNTINYEDLVSVLSVFQKTAADQPSELALVSIN